MIGGSKGAPSEELIFLVATFLLGSHTQVSDLAQRCRQRYPLPRDSDDYAANCSKAVSNWQRDSQSVTLMVVDQCVVAGQ